MSIKKQYFFRYRNILKGVTNAPVELTAEEQLEWEAFLQETGEKFLRLREELDEYNSEIAKELRLPNNLNDWTTQQVIDYLRKIQDSPYEVVFRKGLLQIDNAPDLIDLLEAQSV